jgi:hypothetical protein
MRYLFLGDRGIILVSNSKLKIMSLRFTAATGGIIPQPLTPEEAVYQTKKHGASAKSTKKNEEK